MTTPTPSPAPQQWADKAADEIYTLHVEEGLTGQCDFIAAIITKHAAAISEEVERYRRHMREKVYVDATPDAELPARILSAHINESEYVSNPDTIGILMNDWQRERNKILRQALSDITEATALRQWSERAREAMEALLGLGRKDTSNPKYDGYYKTAQEVIDTHPAKGMEGRG